MKGLTTISTLLISTQTTLLAATWGSRPHREPLTFCDKDPPPALHVAVDGLELRHPRAPCLAGPALNAEELFLLLLLLQNSHDCTIPLINRRLHNLFLVFESVYI